MADPSAEIAEAQEVRLAENITRAMGDDGALGLEAGMRYGITAHGTLGLALLSSRTAGEALRLGVRYGPLTFACTQMRVKLEGAVLQLELEDRHLPRSVRAFLVHRDAAAISVLRKELIGAPPRFFRFEMRCAAPRDLSLYRALWQIVPEFEAAQNIAVASEEILAHTLQRPNGHTLHFCIQHCEALLRARGRAPGTAARVRARLEACDGKLPDMETIAGRLGMTSRTLRRHLADEGTSYRTLTDQARLNRAVQLLRDDQLSLAEVAEQAGYSDPSSFHHSFVRLMGLSPSEYRRRFRGPIRRLL